MTLIVPLCLTQTRIDSLRSDTQRQMIELESNVRRLSDDLSASKLQRDSLEVQNRTLAADVASLREVCSLDHRCGCCCLLWFLAWARVSDIDVVTRTRSGLPRRSASLKSSCCESARNGASPMPHATQRRHAC